jgi:hypothetical protein
MLENSLFNSNVIGADGFYWWIGQVVDNQTWKDNAPAKKIKDPKEIKGWGARYKVRILGHHTDKKSDIKDMDLPWATVLLPVTAGSGHMQSGQTPLIKHGTFVYGFYADGMEAQQPVIMGILENNAQTKLQGKVPTNGFIPFSGHANNERVAVYGIPAGSGNGGCGNPFNNGKALEGSASTPNITSNDDLAQKKVGYDDTLSINKTQKCGGSQLDQAKIAIQNLIKQIENIRNTVDCWAQVAIGKVSSIDIQGKIDQLVAEVACIIAGFIKTIVDAIRKFIQEKTQAAVRPTFYATPIDNRNNVKNAQKIAIDILLCLYNKIINALCDMIANALRNSLDNVVNATNCFIEGLIGTLLGGILGLINGALGAILAPLNAIAGALDIAGDILSLLAYLKGFLTCDESPECSEVTEWTPWGGSNGGLGSSIQSMFDKAKTIAGDFTNAVDIDNFDFASLGKDVAAAFQNCYVGPELCGPPKVRFWGGGGVGAVGNAIVGPTGEVMGVDILSTGIGYNSNTRVAIEDPCGQGNGAFGQVVLGPTRPPGSGAGARPWRNGTGIVEVIMIRPGTGYNNKYNGSQGGMGRTWAGRNQTTVQRSSGKYERPLNPGTSIEVCPGDIVTIPFSTTADITNRQGVVTETLVGGKNIVKKECGLLEAPIPIDPPEDGGLTEQQIQNLGIEAAITSNGSYPVIMQLCEVYVKKTGVNYSPTDTIRVEPPNGAEVVPIFGPYGSIVGVEVISKGEGFLEVPDLIIESETGYNAILVPIMCVNRKGDDLEGELTPEDKTKVVQVIDCVGRV